MNRHFHNTLSAMSATAVMLAAVLIVASPAGPRAEPATRVASVAAMPVPNPTSNAAPQQMQWARAREIEARAEQLTAQLKKARTTSETIAHVAAFTAEVATVTALTAVLEELPESVEAADTSGIETAPPSRRAPRHKRSRQSQAMPYFSFASRS